MNAGKTVAEIRAQNQRLTQGGKLSLQDRQDLHRSISLSDLFISITPNPNSARWR